jgi:hypothetical protein
MYWPAGYTSKIDIERDEEVWSFSIGASIPKDIPVAIGEVLHNIRTPLDHMACAVASDLLRNWRPYKGGNELLWALHDMNRSDKHAEIAPVNLSSGSNSETYLTVWSGMALVLGSRAGQHLYAVRRSRADGIADRDVCRPTRHAA